MTRILLALGQHRQKGAPGYGLVKPRLRGSDLMTLPEKSPRDVAHDQWLPRLIAAGRRLDKDDIKPAVNQIEALIDFRENKRLR